MAKRRRKSFSNNCTVIPLSAASFVPIRGFQQRGKFLNASHVGILKGKGEYAARSAGVHFSRTCSWLVIYAHFT